MGDERAKKGRKIAKSRNGLTSLLADFRAENSLRQSDMAKSAGLTLSGYKAIEYGYFKAGKRAIRGLAKAMRTTPAILSKAQEDKED